MALTIPTLFFLLLFLSSKFPCSTAQTWIKSGYWFSGSEFPVTDINSPLFTHLICAFAGLNSSTYRLSISSSDAQSFSTFSPTVKQKNPTVTTLLSIGGGSANSSTFSSMVSQSNFRKSFIESSIKTARSYGFNGLDFCWVSASTSSEMTNMATLFDEWRLAIESESANSSGSQLILTMAVQFSPDLDNASFPIESIKKNLDWVHVMAYDYYMPSWWNYTAAFAALYDPGSEVSTEYGINAWIHGGLSANKLVLGLPFYGYAWTLVNPNDSAIGAPAKGTAITDDGSMSYKDLKAYMQRYRAVSEYNATYVVNYCVIGSNWIAYDDVDVVKIKVAYAKKMNLLGYFVWQVPYDDENWVLSYQAGSHFDVKIPNRSYGFHDLDLDWEYPQSTSEMANMGALLNEWRAAVATEAHQSAGQPPLVLTAAFYYAPSINGLNYPVQSKSNSLDWINLMAYDFYDPSWAKVTNSHAALYDPSGPISGSYGVGSWIQAGVSPTKLVLGMPFYGYVWQLADAITMGLWHLLMGRLDRATLRGDLGVHSRKQGRNGVQWHNCFELLLCWDNLDRA
ncbi:hypothetical protein RHSIM_Rhsim01G0042500 [Rhododendron simsii]|uniref:GH18 domain-containing protein n=1 Tax=Rhododendron simsii TaxID=118357 RepID=A0A834HGF3_RHOSS|nr:hypothetical protein RHSIM_Rhsim01G0042500 [Rhododendron simsii]